MRKMRRHWLPALLSLLLAGCLSSTPPSNFYLLSARADGVPTGDSPGLGIGPIEIPEYLNRSGMVYSDGGEHLQISSFERWAEPLEDGLQRVLSLNLASLLDTQDIRTFPWAQQRAPEYAVQVRVLALDTKAARATLVAEWSLRRPADGELLERNISHLQQDLAGEAFAAALIAPAYSELLYQLSQLIADSIRRQM